MSLCNCDSGFLNTGLPNCTLIAGVTKKLIAVQTIANDGTTNCIDIDADLVDGKLTDAFVQGKLNEADPSKRWQPLGEFKNVDDLKGNSITQSFNDGSSIFIQEGSRTFSGLIVGKDAPFELLSKLNSGRCVDFSVYAVDNDGSLIGTYDKETGQFCPTQVDRNTFQAILNKKTDTTEQAITVSFEFSRLEKDEDLKIFTSDDIETNLLKVKGLVDVDQVITTPTTTGLVDTLCYEYGAVQNPSKFVGAVLADFTMFNVTTSSAVVITSVTEGADGVYTFVYPAQTAADVITVSFSKTGFSSVDVSATLS